jgi:RNA polymerase-interacting CarD/CdnL/TRCF family regulator
MERLRKHKKFLHNILKDSSDKKELRKSINKADKGEICTICEIVKNLLENKKLNIQLTEQERKILTEHQKQLKKLVNRNIPYERKKRLLLLQKGGGVFLPIVLALMGPVLQKLISAIK